MIDRVRDRLRRGLWHALNRYDELKRRVRENHAGRSAVGLAGVVLLGVGAALGFIVANAAARQDTAQRTAARASDLGAVYTVTQAIVRQKTVREIAAKHAGARPPETLTITRRSRTFAFAPTETVTRTVKNSRTVTVTDVQPTTVTVIETDTDKQKP